MPLRGYKVSVLGNDGADIRRRRSIVPPQTAVRVGFAKASAVWRASSWHENERQYVYECAAHRVACAVDGRHRVPVCPPR